jgi:hypothetical protein
MGLVDSGGPARGRGGDGVGCTGLHRRVVRLRVDDARRSACGRGILGAGSGSNARRPRSRWGPYRRSDDVDAVGSKDGVETRREFGVAVSDQEPNATGPLPYHHSGAGSGGIADCGSARDPVSSSSYTRPRPSAPRSSTDGLGRLAGCELVTGRLVPDRRPLVLPSRHSRSPRAWRLRWDGMSPPSGW